MNEIIIKVLPKYLEQRDLLLTNPPLRFRKQVQIRSK